MKLPVIEKFFCCIELRPATLGIGWGYTILLSISFVSFLLSLMGGNTNHGGSVATSIVCIISIVFSVLIILGVKRDKPNYVQLGMYFLMVHAVLLAITCIVSLLSVGLVVLFIYLPLAIYCAITVYSYHKQMTGQTTPIGGV